MIVKGLPTNLLYSILDTLLLKEIQATIPEAIHFKIECRHYPAARYITGKIGRAHV